MATLINSLVSRVRVRILETLALMTPGAPLVAPQGTPGATAYSYKVVATVTAGHSAASAAGSTATGAATLTGTNYNQLNWAQVSRATGYKVYRTVGGSSQGLIATIASGATLTLNDTGLAGDSATAPTDNTSGVLGTYWSDDELREHAISAAKDLWRRFTDLHEDHFVTIDEENVSAVVNDTVLDGVPEDVFRVLLLEPRDVTDNGAARGLRFIPAKFNSDEFRADRRLGSVDPSGGAVVRYAILNAGSPVDAPTIKLSRALSSTTLLTLEYIHTLDDDALREDDAVNPIPGESDEAMLDWMCAFALGKQNPDGHLEPDGTWMALYEKQAGLILQASAPRQEQQPRIVRGVFDDFDDEWF
jgi:hypothetical protein